MYSIRIGMDIGWASFQGQVGSNVQPPFPTSPAFHLAQSSSCNSFVEGWRVWHGRRESVKTFQSTQFFTVIALHIFILKCVYYLYFIWECPWLQLCLHTRFESRVVDLVPCLFAEIERVSDGFISSSGQQTGDRQPRVRGTFEGWVLLQTGCWKRRLHLWDGFSKWSKRAMTGQRILRKWANGQQGLGVARGSENSKIYKDSKSRRWGGINGWSLIMWTVYWVLS